MIRSIAMFRRMDQAENCLRHYYNYQVDRARDRQLQVTVEAPGASSDLTADCNTKYGMVTQLQEHSIGPHNSRKFPFCFRWLKNQVCQMLPDTSTSITADLIMLFVAYFALEYK